MELQSLANLGDFLGGIGVVFSLVYLAFQVRGNTRSQRNDIAARALERLGNMQREMATNTELNEMTTSALVDCYQVDVLDRIRFAWWLTYPGVREWWRCRPTPFTQSFTAYTETMLKSGYQYPDRAAWEAYLARSQIETTGQKVGI